MILLLSHGHKDANKKDEKCLVQVSTFMNIHTIYHVLEKRIKEDMEIVTPIVVDHLNIVSPEYCSDRSS